MTKLNPQIFREYDIRGTVENDLNEEVFETLGKAYGTLAHRSSGKRTVSLGRDCRLSSEAFALAFARGVASTGVNVVDLGMVTTPILYFSLFNLPVEGGAMITASHNPPDYNGVKMTIGTDALFGEGIKKIRDIAEKADFERGRGRISSESLLERYVSYLESHISIKPGLRIALDCGNGTAGIVAPRVMKDLGCELTELYTTPDGTFPNHHPDPGVMENLRDLISAVTKGGCQAGIAFDGDADRIGVVDEKGEVVWGDMLLLIYARDILRQVPGATIIGDIKSSNRLYNDIEKRGGKGIMWRTGHSIVKAKLKSEGAELAGEMSGHIFFKHRFFGYDDALYASLRLLEIISQDGGRKVSELLEGIPEAVSTPEIRVDCPDEVKFSLVEVIKEKLGRDYEINDIDGVRVEFPDGWGLVRASNTQPALVLRFEAQTPERLEEIRSLIEGKIEEAKRIVGERHSRPSR